MSNSSFVSSMRVCSGRCKLGNVMDMGDTLGLSSILMLSPEFVTISTSFKGQLWQLHRAFFPLD